MNAQKHPPRWLADWLGLAGVAMIAAALACLHYAASLAWLGAVCLTLEVWLAKSQGTSK